MNQTVTTRRRAPRQQPAEQEGERDTTAALAGDMQAHAHEAAGLLKALSHETRLLILCHLSCGELSVGDINERVRLSQSALSQHLAVLRREGLVVTRRHRQSIFYHLADTGAAQVLAVLHDLYCARAGKHP